MFTKKELKAKAKNQLVIPEEDIDPPTSIAVAKKLGYQCSHDGLYSYPDSDDPQGQYEFTKALQAEIRDRAIQSVQRNLKDLRHPNLNISECRLALQQIQLDLTDIQGIPDNLVTEVIDVMRAIPRYQSSSNPEAIPQPLARQPEILKLGRRIWAWIETDRATQHEPFPTLEEYLLRVQEQKASKQVITVKED